MSVDGGGCPASCVACVPSPRRSFRVDQCSHRRDISYSSDLAVTKTAISFIFRQRVINVQFVISVVEPTNSGKNCVHEGHVGLGNSKDR